MDMNSKYGGWEEPWEQAHPNEGTFDEFMVKTASAWATVLRQLPVPMRLRLAAAAVELSRAGEE